MTTVTMQQPQAVTDPDARRLHRYIPEFDVLRGVAIVLVVYLHAWFSPWAGTPHREVVWVHVVHLFGQTAVPVFFFVSAYLLAQDRSPGWQDFVRRKLSRIAVPTLVWMVAALAYEVWQQGGLSGDLMKEFVFFNVAGQYYYLAVLIFFMAAFWPLRKLPQRWLGVLAVVAFVANVAMIAWYQGHNVTGDWATLEYRNPLVWVSFCAFGFWAGARWESLAWTRRWRWWAFGAMAALAAVYFVRGEAFDAYPRSYFGVEMFLFSSCALVGYPAMIEMVMRCGRVGRVALAPWRGLSRFAFGIYLVHMPFFVGYVTTRLVSNNTHVNGDYFQLTNSIFLVGFVAAAAFVILVDRAAPSVANLLLGTNRPRVRPPAMRRVVASGTERPLAAPRKFAERKY